MFSELQNGERICNLLNLLHYTDLPKETDVSQTLSVEFGSVVAENMLG